MQNSYVPLSCHHVNNTPNINRSQCSKPKYTRHIIQAMPVVDTNTYLYSSSKNIIKSVRILNTLLDHSNLYLFNTNTWVWYLLKPWRKLQIVLRFDCSVLLHPHMRILFQLNESCIIAFTITVLFKELMILGPYA